MKTRKKRKRIETIEQRIISNYIKLGTRPREAFKKYQNLMFKSEMNFINATS